MDYTNADLQNELDLLDTALIHARAFLEGLDQRPISPSGTVESLRAGLGLPLPESGVPAQTVLDELAEAVAPGLLATSSPRFFGWVMGGVLPVALAADWMTAAWDQNAASFATSPAASIAEEVCGAWLKDVLGLPASASFGFVTGCQMAHATALAAARHALLARRGHDVEADGLSGTPQIRILTGRHRHESIVRAVRLLGLGSRAITLLDCGADGRLEIGALRQALAEAGEAPCIVILQAGDMATGVFDDFAPACAAAHEAGAWVHVDGAFGLWAAASPRLRHLMDGAALADSWVTDGHKWLNQGFDSGYVFVADPAAHRGAFALDTSYSYAVDGTRRQIDWNPEWSRRARVFATYATLRTLGRQGVAELVERNCALLDQLVARLSDLPGVTILSPPVINQALVSFGDDARTDAVVAALQAEGLAWFGATTWRGKRAMRMSLCNWKTSEHDVALSVDAVAAALKAIDQSGPRTDAA